MLFESRYTAFEVREEIAMFSAVRRRHLLPAPSRSSARLAHTFVADFQLGEVVRLVQNLHGYSIQIICQISDSLNLKPPLE